MGEEDGCDGSLEAIIKTSCPVIWTRGLIVSLGVSKTTALATMSQQAHAYWELRNWSPSTWIVCGIWYKFTFAWVFVSHACTRITMNTYISDLVLFTGIQC